MSRVTSISLPGAKQAPGFEEPFEMLRECHGRVHRMLDLLARLRQHVAQHGADEQARQAARDVMRYFDVAAPEHHLDEELHVFPPLIAQGEEPVVSVVRRLQADHAEMERQWQDARRVLGALAEGALADLDAAQSEVLTRFASLYGRHIEDEEGIAYPRAQSSLDAQALDAMTRDMTARRQTC